MKVLVLNVEDGSSKQCDEKEVSQEELDWVDQGLAEVIRWNQENQQYERAAVEITKDDEGSHNITIAQWNSL